MSSESGLIFSSISCLIAIIVLLCCQLHSIWNYVRNRSTIAPAQKKAMLMECTMITLFLLATLSNVCLRSNYLLPFNKSAEDFSPFLCQMSMVLVIGPYSSGKVLLYAALMHRIYKTFENSIFHIRK
eukprot:329094_1